MSSSSRAANFSNNSYEFVNPEMFGSDDDDALFKMPPKEIISEDEDIGIPLRAGWSTESSGYTTTWSMSSSRGGSTQSSNQGSPEFGGGNVLPQPVASTSAFSSSLLHSRVSSEDAPKRSSSGGSRERDQNQQEKPTSSTTTTTTTSSLTIAKQRIPGPSYIGPVLTTLSEPTDEESEFEKFKMQIRIQKIIEFHQEAARAGIKLALDIHNAHKAASRDLKGKSRDDAVKVAEHERFMRELQVVKEEERRRVVGEERERRRAEIKKRGRGRGEKGKSGEVLEEGEFEVDLEAQFGVDEIVRGVRGAKVFSASVSSSASASAAASPTEERFQDLYSTPSSFSSYMDHGHWEPPQQTKSSSPSGMQTRNSMRVLPPVQRDEEEEEYEGEEEEIPSDIMAALVAGGGLETQQDWLFGSSSTSTSTSASAASSMASSLANPLALSLPIQSPAPILLHRAPRRQLLLLQRRKKALLPRRSWTIWGGIREGKREYWCGCRGPRCVGRERAGCCYGLEGE
ncbi:hypothetical protein BDQ17DRAFT_394627 [Cyathus striatus]|nr:hypothetical protein BDQ17DRAFT_394627 [Cyathus striatus]